MSRPSTAGLVMALLLVAPAGTRMVAADDEGMSPPPAATAAAPDPAGSGARAGGPTASAAPAEGPRVVLFGSFGKVPGGPTDHPAAAAPDGRPLQAWLRSEPMTLLTKVASAGPPQVVITAQEIAGDTDPVVLARDSATFPGPDRPGTYTITATFRDATAGPVQRSWLVSVPDRTGGPEALFDVPGPTGLLSSATATVAGQRGHGCYVYVCAEAGYAPPTETLEALAIAVGETPSLRLDDGSAFVHWVGDIRRGDPGAVIETGAQAAYDDPVAGADLSGLEPRAPGRWILQVRVDYDRGRGWQWFIYRLDAG
jgi:hypothetical protein